MKIIKNLLRKIIVGRNCLKKDKTLKRFNTLLQKSDIISFDMFDTLVCRNVAKPIDIFKIQEKWIDDNYKMESNFAQKRHDTEMNLYQEKGSKVLLEDIYNKLSEDYGKEMSEVLMNKELELERKFIITKNDGMKLFNICKKSGKKIIITSDMYLPSWFLSEILNNLGYSFDEIFVSGEVGYSKKDKMFEFLKTKFNNNKILHIGDNIKVDFLNPKNQGLKAYNVDKARIAASDKISISIAESLLYNKKYEDNLDKFGYKYFGPMLYDFCVWVHNMKEEKQIDNLLFLSRGGYMAFKVYEKLFPQDKIEYIRISRKLVIWIKLLKDQSIQNIYSVLLDLNRKMTIKNLCDVLQLKDIEISQGIDSDKEYTVEDFSTNQAVSSFYSRIQPLVKEKAEKYCDLIRRYLASSIEGNSRIGLVDEGWKGVIQDNLNLFYTDKKFYGLYMGTTVIEEDKYGFLARAKTNFKDFVKIFFSMGFIEEINGENAPSLVGLQDGKEIQLIYAKQSSEEKNSKKIFEKIQGSAINFVDDFVNFLGNISRDSLNYKEMFLKFLDNPPKSFVAEIMDSYTDDAGLVGHVINYTQSKSILKRIKVSRDSAWKMASLKINFSRIGYFLVRFLVKLKVTLKLRLKK